MMRYLHTMIRITHLDQSLRFYCDGLGFEVISREDYPKERFSLVFLKYPNGEAHEPLLELTHNWDIDQYDRGNAYGHVAYQVDSIESIQSRLKKNGFDLSWGPGTTPSGKRKMAFVDDPDGYEIELLEEIK
jgi:lactoylglutathione lyase